MGNLLSEDGKPTFGVDQDEYTEEGLFTNCGTEKIA